MILFVVNYKDEIDHDYFSKYDFIDIKVLNEKKGSVFGLKLMKLLSQSKDKYDMVLHFGLCGAREIDQIGDIYKIDRTFLFYKDIIENQRFRHGNYAFDSVITANIVTKFSLGPNHKKLYDFADIFDLETFWVAQVSSQVALPVFSFKGVSDINHSFLYHRTVNQEIDHLLGSRQDNLGKIADNIDLVRSNFKDFFEGEFLSFYDKFVSDKSFQKSFYV